MMLSGLKGTVTFRPSSSLIVTIFSSSARAATSKMARANSNASNFI
ncbi:MAG: hypothetical protein A4E49_02843 [Methanosaeta sp. PtaU1.Bin112]|nr:MAG: hypothetical protein A4E49_02843 [Methanosaeta sp. PtaU1.Bin112]